MAELGQLAKVAYRIVALEAHLTEERADNAKLQEEIASTEESSMHSPSPRTTWLHSGKLYTRTTGASMWPQMGLGMSVPHPEFPDETTVLVSLGSLITKLETAASSHADQVD
ncbi:hypothetical protein OsI_12277 [Oryza sativa Indica Group]|uniref:Uncharacterized protein n=1 Tax=Oryza sativa subsp. indica TaxID=39946 RepID=A2XIL6_ORYSI|nr:hypothetical protein OsI_12277 [Oryza sativa Indica Group]